MDKISVSPLLYRVKTEIGRILLRIIVIVNGNAVKGIIFIFHGAIIDRLHAPAVKLFVEAFVKAPEIINGQIFPLIIIRNLKSYRHRLSLV